VFLSKLLDLATRSSCTQAALKCKQACLQAKLDPKNLKTQQFQWFAKDRLASLIQLNLAAFKTKHSNFQWPLREASLNDNLQKNLSPKTIKTLFFQAARAPHLHTN